MYIIYYYIIQYNNTTQYHTIQYHTMNDPENTTNPDINVFLYHENVNDKNDIYLLRYNINDINEHFLNFIKNNYEDIFNTIKSNLFPNVSVEVIRLGYFYLENRNISYVNINDLSPVPIIPYDYFIYFCRNTIINQFVIYVLEKAYFEMLLRKKNSTYFSVDLYYDRAATRANEFHLDSTPEMPVDFFTLTYLLPNDTTIMKGLTIISKNARTQYKYSLSPAIKNGTTLGIDNDIIYHSTPSTIIADTNTGLIIEPYHLPNTENTYLHIRQQNPYIDTNIDTTQKRSFIRNWYYKNNLSENYNLRIPFHSIENDIFVDGNRFFHIINKHQYKDTGDADFINNLIWEYRSLTLGGDKALGDKAIGGKTAIHYGQVSHYPVLKIKNEIKSPKSIHKKVTLEEIKEIFENPNSNFVIYTKQIKKSKKTYATKSRRSKSKSSRSKSKSSRKSTN